MRAAYAFLDGTFETITQAALEFCCQRSHVTYYVRKLAGQGITRSESTQSSRSRRSESSERSRRLSSPSTMSPSSHGDIENEPARNAVVPGPADDPWARYCMAYMYAGRLVSLHGRKVAAQRASERYGVCISNGTARRAAISGGPPSKRGPPLIIPCEIEIKVEELCLCLRELKLPVFRFMVLNDINILVASTDIAERLRHKEVHH